MVKKMAFSFLSFFFLTLSFCYLTFGNPPDSARSSTPSSGHRRAGLRRQFHRARASSRVATNQDFRTTLISSLPGLLDLRARLLAGEIDPDQHTLGILSVVERFGPDVFQPEASGGRQQEFINALADTLAMVAQQESTGGTTSHEGSSAGFRGYSLNVSTHPDYPRQLSEASFLARLPTAGVLQVLFDVWSGYQMMALRTADAQGIQRLRTLNLNFSIVVLFSSLSLWFVLVMATDWFCHWPLNSFTFAQAVSSFILSGLGLVYGLLKIKSIESEPEIIGGHEPSNTGFIRSLMQKELDAHSDLELSRVLDAFSVSLEQRLTGRLIRGETSLGTAQPEGAQTGPESHPLTDRYLQPIRDISAAVSHGDLDRAVHVLTSAVCGSGLENVSTGVPGVRVNLRDTQAPDRAQDSEARSAAATAATSGVR